MGGEDQPGGCRGGAGSDDRSKSGRLLSIGPENGDCNRGAGNGPVLCGGDVHRGHRSCGLAGTFDSFGEFIFIDSAGRFYRAKEEWDLSVGGTGDEQVLSVPDRRWRFVPGDQGGGERLLLSAVGDGADAGVRGA